MFDVMLNYVRLARKNSRKYFCREKPVKKCQFPLRILTILVLSKKCNWVFNDTLFSRRNRFQDNASSPKCSISFDFQSAVSSNNLHHGVNNFKLPPIFSKTFTNFKILKVLGKHLRT